MRSRLRKRDAFASCRGRRARHGGECLVVAGVVEQTRRHVDGIAEVVAGHLDDFAVRQADLQLERRGSAACGKSACRAGADAFQRVVHLVGGLHGLRGSSKIAIRPSPSVLTTLPPQLATTRASSATLWVTTEVASALPSVSYSAVLPRRSAKRTVRWIMRVMRAARLAWRQFIVTRAAKS